jgi:GR25 family glycosyltransferase involved in LPS biosynthesis
MNEIKNCFYLNLDRRPDRKEHIENELNKSFVLKNLYERFSAIDGLTIHPRSLPDGLITQNALEDILSDTVSAWGLSLTQGGLGVLLSYIELFKKISQLSGTSIIFEDDSIISENFDTYLTTVLKELPEDFDICYLGHGDVTVKKNEYSQNLSIPSGMIVCLPSLIVSPNGAKKILENLKNRNLIERNLTFKNNKIRERLKLSNENKIVDTDIIIKRK